eukprot:jgi/Tetstr1/423841/TSEL_014467.t1
MEKLNLDDPDTKSADIVAENIEALSALFPEAFTEGRIDFDVLKQLLGGAVDESSEKYGLNWHGKRRSRQIALTPSAGTLLPYPEDSVDWDTTQNLMIEGDNLEVLKLLQKSYASKHSEHLVPGRTEQDVLYELLLKLGLDLCVPIEKREIAGKAVHSIGAGALMVCLADSISRDTVEELANGIVAWHKELAPAVDTRVVFKDSGFADDVAKTNMAAILDQNGINDVRSL